MQKSVHKTAIRHFTLARYAEYRYNGRQKAQKGKKSRCLRRNCRKVAKDAAAAGEENVCHQSPIRK